MRNVSGGAQRSGAVVFEAVTEYGQRYENWQAGFDRACDRFLRERVPGWKAYSEHCAEARARRCKGALKKEEVQPGVMRWQKRR